MDTIEDEEQYERKYQDAWENFELVMTKFGFEKHNEGGRDSIRYIGTTDELKEKIDGMFFLMGMLYRQALLSALSIEKANKRNKRDDIELINNLNCHVNSLLTMTNKIIENYIVDGKRDEMVTEISIH